MAEISKYIWFDGKFLTKNKAKVPVTTHAIHYGTSIFEGIRAYWNEENLFIFRLDAVSYTHLTLPTNREV